MKIALVAEDATALSHATSSEPAAQETRVAALATELARQQHEVTVYARKDAGDLPEQAELPGGVTVRYVPAGPAEPLADEAVLPHIRSFSDSLAGLWQDDKPDVVHAIGWTGGLAALAATRDRSIPVVQTFHSLRAAERRHHIASDGSTLAEHAEADSGARDRLERAAARSADLVIATNEDEVSDLAGLGVPRSGISALRPGGPDRPARRAAAADRGGHPPEAGRTGDRGPRAAGDPGRRADHRRRPGPADAAPGRGVLRPGPAGRPPRRR
jgi:D-inositol-3-phosphate glycosyltransferase